MLVTTVFALAALLLLIFAIDALIKKFQRRKSTGDFCETGAPSPTHSGDTNSGSLGTDTSIHSHSNHPSAPDAGGHHGGFSGHGGDFGGGGFGGYGH